MAVPLPLVLRVSRKNSALVILDPPVVASLTKAVRVTEEVPAVGFGVTVRLEVKGRPVSGGAETEKEPETVEPQLLAASLPRTIRE
jgi:hypothetical protein